jgi:hypothetical protein
MLSVHRPSGVCLTGAQFVRRIVHRSGLRWKSVHVQGCFDAGHVIGCWGGMPRVGTGIPFDTALGSAASRTRMRGDAGPESIPPGERLRRNE